MLALPKRSFEIIMNAQHNNQQLLLPSLLLTRGFMAWGAAVL